MVARQCGSEQSTAACAGGSEFGGGWGQQPAAASASPSAARASDKLAFPACLTGSRQLDMAAVVVCRVVASSFAVLQFATSMQAGSFAWRTPTRPGHHEHLLTNCQQQLPHSQLQFACHLPQGAVL